jgi:WD40 repeat protein
LTDFPLAKVTSVRYSPDGKMLAVGDDKGKVKLFKVEGAEGKPYTLEKEHSMIAGPVFALGFTDDGQRLAAGGEGKDMLAKAVLASSGTKIGDIFGPSKPVTTLDIKPKPYRLVLGGENQEVYVFDGVPFKHAKTLNQHTNFVNRIIFSPSSKFFVSVSSDKSIVLYDS